MAYIRWLHRRRAEGEGGGVSGVLAQGGEVWKEHGALEYVECVGDDVSYGERTSSSSAAVQAAEEETVVFAGSGATRASIGTR